MRRLGEATAVALFISVLVLNAALALLVPALVVAFLLGKL